MRAPLPFVTLTLLALLTTPASAGKRRRKAPVPRPAAAAAAAPSAASAGADAGATAKPVNPAAGTCGYAQPSVKICSLSQGMGSFDVLTFPPALVLLTFEEPIKSLNPPDPQYYQTDYRDRTVTIVPRDGVTLPARTPLVITTETASVTISLRPGDLQQVDTQVIIKDPERDLRTAEIERRVRAREQELERAFAARLQAQADLLLLQDLVGGGGDVHAVGGKGITSNSDQIVLIGEKAVRVGERRYLLIAIDNRSDATFEVRDVKVFLEEGGDVRPLKVTWRFAQKTVAAGAEMHGAVFLPLKKKPSGKARLKLRVEETDASRSVELGGMKVP